MGCGDRGERCLRLDLEEGVCCLHGFMVCIGWEVVWVGDDVWMESCQLRGVQDHVLAGEELVELWRAEAIGNE